MADTPDNSVVVRASPTFSYALILPLVLAIGGGVVWTTQQAQAIAQMRLQLDRQDAAMDAKFAGYDALKDKRTDALASLDSRLARIEAQLAFLVQNRSAK